METPANKVPVNLEGSAVPDRSSKRPGKEDKSKRKDDKSVDQVMKGLNNLETTEEKLAAMCKKFAEVMDENRKLQLTAKQFEKGLNVVQREKEQLQTDHSKAVLTRSRLESLCRELQRQNKAVKEESLLKVREEEEKRKEVSAKFNATLAEITSLMSSSNEKTNKLRDENLDITKKFKSICEQNGLQQQQVDKMNMQRKLEAELSEAKLTKQKLEFTAEKEILLRDKQQLLMDLQEARTRMCDMNSNESALKSQVALYSDRYEEFQNALSRSNEVFGGFKGEMDKMSKKIVKLEKETMSWKNRWEKSHQALLEMATDKQQRDAELALTQRQLAQLQKLCRTLQTERTGLLAQIKGTDKPSDLPVEEATVPSNGLDINTDAGGGDILIDTPFVLNGLANSDDCSKVVQQSPESIKEPVLVADHIQPKPAVQETKQNIKSGNKSNKKVKPETVVAQTLLDNSVKVEKPKPSEQESKAVKKNVPKNDKSISAEKSTEPKQKPIAPPQPKPSEVLLVAEKQTNIMPVADEIAKSAETVVAQNDKGAPSVDLAVVVGQLVETPIIPVIAKQDVKPVKGGNQKVNKKSKPVEPKVNDVVKSVVIEKVINAEEISLTSPQTQEVKEIKPVLDEKVKGKDSKPAEPEKVVTAVKGGQKVASPTEKSVGVLLAENIKSLEASTGKVEDSVKPKEEVAAVQVEKKEAVKGVEIELQDNSPKQEQPKVEKPVEIKKEEGAKTEKPKDIKKVEQVSVEPPKISQKDKQVKEEKPTATAAVAPASNKVATMADKVKMTSAVKEVDVKPKGVKIDEVNVGEKPRPETKTASTPPAEVPNIKQNVASADSKPCGSVVVPPEKPLTPVENTINAILRVLEASIKQKQAPKEPAKELVKGAKENSKPPTNETPSHPAKETINTAAKEPHATPPKVPVKENPSSNSSPAKEPAKAVSNEPDNNVPKAPVKVTAEEAPTAAGKDTKKDAAKIPAVASPKNAHKSQKNDKAQSKPPAKDLPKSPSKEAAKPAPPQSAAAVEKEGPTLPLDSNDSQLIEKGTDLLPSSNEAATAAVKAPVTEPVLSVGALELKESSVKAAELAAPPTCADKAATPVLAETTETKKVKEGGKKRKK